MKINNIKDMEAIVDSNPDMEWDSWTVVIYTNDDGYYNKDGVYRNEKWQTKYTFEMVDYGVWNIPDRFITHVQV